MTQDPVLATPQYLAIHRWVQAASGIPQERIRWADNSSPWPSVDEGPWISIRDLGESEQNTYTITRRRVYSFLDISVSAIAGDVLSCMHAFTTGDGPVRITGDDADYWVIVVGAGSVSLAASFLDARNGVVASLAGKSLPLAISSTSTTMRFGAEAEHETVGPSTRELSIQVFGLGAMSIARTISTRGRSPKLTAALVAANVGVLGIGGIQNLGASLDSATFLPRAAMTARLSVSQSHIEVVGVIETVETMGTTT